MIEFIKNIDWVAVFTVILALFGIARIITGLTPTEKDNEFVAKIGVECSSDLKEAKVGISILPDNLSKIALQKTRRRSSHLCQILKKMVEYMDLIFLTKELKH